jgi:hypothetical protein
LERCPGSLRGEAGGGFVKHGVEMVIPSSCLPQVKGGTQGGFLGTEDTLIGISHFSLLLMISAAERRRKKKKPTSVIRLIWFKTPSRF